MTMRSRSENISSHMLKSTKLCGIDTELCADSVEVFNEDVIYCCYELNKETCRKSGSVNLIHIDDENGNVVPVDSVQSSAVFDAKWNLHHQDGSEKIIATANYGNTVHIWKVENSELIEVTSCLLDEDTSQSCLSLHWLERDRIITSTSDGKLCYFDVSVENTCVKSPISTWNAHTLYSSPIETWIVSGSNTDSNIVWSGGDDSVLKGWDIRSPVSPTFVNKSCHSAGICSMQWHPNRDHSVVTGSYDEHVAFWDDRLTSKPVFSKKIASSGIWRLKWHPSKEFSHLLLAACMYDGCKLVDVDVESHHASTLVVYAEHKSLAYGIDWYFPKKSNESAVDASRPWVISCSFYDHSLQVWEPCMPITTPRNSSVPSFT
jgi:diphthine methyl ester acylhydrolase